MSRLKTLLHKLNTWQVEVLLVILVVLVILRIPNLTEPYWYGDEAIYLTIGAALRQGHTLYLDIIDHKTPLIYYLAMVPSQLLFRILLMGWMIVTTTLFYTLALRILHKLLPAAVATGLCMLFTTLPWLEGNIPNGELFMMGFVLLGGVLFTQLAVVRAWLGITKPTHSNPVREVLLAGLSGFAFGLGILTKVPALFDVVAFLSIGWWALIFSVNRNPVRTWLPQSGEFLKYSLLVGLGIGVSIAISVLYFSLRGAGQAYLDYGLLYNFRYAGSWVPHFSSTAIAFWFTLTGKTLLVVLMGVLLTGMSRWIPARLLFIPFWSVLALFAATLSNRPYPHYLIQVVPPLSLAIGWLVLTLHQSTGPQRWLVKLRHLCLIAIPLLATIGVWQLLGFQRYPTREYYHHFARLITGQISYVTYAEAFNGSIRDNARILPLIKNSNSPYFFVWGTNPILYAQTQKNIPNRFTVVFHIKDFQAQAETLQRVVQSQPEYIVVMNDERDSFPELNQYLQTNYMANSSFDTLVLWKKWN